MQCLEAWLLLCDYKAACNNIPLCDVRIRQFSAVSVVTWLGIYTEDIALELEYAAGMSMYSYLFQYWSSRSIGYILMEWKVGFVPTRLDIQQGISVSSTYITVDQIRLCDIKMKKIETYRVLS
jgi:hypothetical protein